MVFEVSILQALSFLTISMMGLMAMWSLFCGVDGTYIYGGQHSRLIFGTSFLTRLSNFHIPDYELRTLVVNCVEVRRPRARRYRRC
jgi:hypothetical protein